MAPFFEYTVLRVVPDRRRGECVNIGIAVFLEGGVDVRVLPSMGKVIALDGNINTSELRELPKTIEAWAGRFSSTKERHSALRELGIVTVTDLGRFSIPRLSDYEAAVAALMKSLVSPKAAAGRQFPLNQRITSSLKEKFRANKILGHEANDIAKHLVVPNYPIESDEGLFADFVLKNSVYHVTETADLRAQSSSNIDRVRIASLAAIKLHKAVEAFGKRTKRYAVVASKAGSSDQPVNLLVDYADQVFHLENRSDMASYMELMMDAASPTHSIRIKHSREAGAK